MIYRNYEDYIPITNKSNLVFEKYIYFIEDAIICNYDTSTGIKKKLFNYPKEFGLKSCNAIKFEVRQKGIKNISPIIYFIILCDVQTFYKMVLLYEYNIHTNTVTNTRKFDDRNK